nr:two-component system VirA-like sensor kinase [Bradyrhizobium sp. NBAIM14]
MRSARWVPVAIGLSVLLTWFSWRAANPEAELYDRALAEIDRFGMIEDTLYRDLFTARAGLLRNYDPLVSEIDGLRQAIARLRATAQVDSQTTETINRLAASVDRQEELVECFKSRNAVLHNSLSFFTRFAVNSDQHDLDFAIRSAATAILHLTLDTSSVAVREAEERLDELDAQATGSGQVALVEPFLAHGRLLHRLLPSVDDILKTTLTLRQKQDQETLRTAILHRGVASRHSARVYRVMLYGSSIALIALLIYLGLRLKSRANALHRRAALEHIIADISMGFINATPQGIEAEIQRAIASFGTFAGSDRVYVVVSGMTTECYLWHQPGREFPPGWPEGAIDLASRMADGEGVVHVPDVRRMSVGDNKIFLERMGLGGWACAINSDRQGRMIAFGFDAVGCKCRVAHTDELVLLRMALDTFIHAVERRTVEEERNRLQKRLQQARRMERIGTFTSGIAHNFNNILGGILGHAEVMEEHARLSSPLVRHLAGIRRSADRARDLVSQILIFGRRSDIRRNPVSIGALVAETVSLLRVALPPRIEIVVRQHPAGLIVSGDSVQLQQVIMNLCNNAANAIPETGRIEIEIELHEVLDPTCLSHDTIEPGQYVRISVLDTGVGMDGATLDRIFEPFFTTRSSGNGLGLATVKEIILDHGGGINVRSCPGEGSHFDIWLRRATAVVSAEPPPPAHLTGQGKVVMLVAGDRHRLLTDEEMLAALGFEAVGFATVEAARAAAKAAPNRFDIVVVGPVCALGQSPELATMLHNELPSVPIILATRTAFEISADALLAAGISDVVRWPLVAEEIAIVLSQVFRACEPGVSRRPKSQASVALANVIACGGMEETEDPARQTGSMTNGPKGKGG